MLKKIIISSLMCLFIILNGCGDTDVSPKTNVKMKAHYTAEDVKLSQYNWQGDIPTAGKIRVNNPFGNISTKNTNYDNVSIAGAIQLIGNEATQPNITVRDENGVTVVDVSYPNGDKDQYGRKIGRVDLGVYVPRSVIVDLQTDYGAIKSRKHKSNMILKTNSGDIKVGASGTIQATSNSGDIKLHIQKAKHQDIRFIEEVKRRLSHITTESGAINISLANNLDMQLNLQASSGISSNLNEFKEVRLIENSNNNLTAVLGNGINTYTVRSNQSAIAVKMLQVKKDVSMVSSPTSYSGSITDLKKVEPWQPGDEIFEVQDGRAEKTMPKEKSIGKPKEKTKEKSKPNSKKKEDN